MDKIDEEISVLNGQIKAYEGPDDYAFVSYSDKDAEIVFPNLVLLNDLGLNIFYKEGYEKPLRPEDIREKIKNSKIFIPFITPNVTFSSSMGKEILKATVIHLRHILPIYLKETDLDPQISSLIGDNPSILQYELSEDEYKKKCNSELTRIGLKVKERPLKSRLEYMHHLFFIKKSEAFPFQLNIMQERPKPPAQMMKKDIGAIQKFISNKDSKDFYINIWTTYVCFSHDDIDLIFEDFILFRKCGIRLIYDEEIEFDNEEISWAWISEIEPSIKNQPVFVFYASNKSLSSKKRIHELRYAIDNDIPVCISFIEDIDKDEYSSIITSILNYSNLYYINELKRALRR